MTVTRLAVLPLAAVAATLLVATAAAGAVRETPPAPELVRPCGSRGDSSKPQRLPWPVGARIGPLVVWPSIRNRVEEYGGEWPFYVKAPIVLPARTVATLAVPADADGLLAFQGPAGRWVSAVRFEACREDVRAFPGSHGGTVGAYTGFPFGFALARRQLCVPLEVWVGERRVRTVVAFGRRSCT